jgi:hypothetical protein
MVIVVALPKAKETSVAVRVLSEMVRHEGFEAHALGVAKALYPDSRQNAFPLVHRTFGSLQKSGYVYSRKADRGNQVVHSITIRGMLYLASKLSALEGAEFLNQLGYLLPSLAKVCQKMNDQGMGIQQAILKNYITSAVELLQHDLRKFTSPEQKAQSSEGWIFAVEALLRDLEIHVIWELLQEQQITLPSFILTNVRETLRAEDAARNRLFEIIKEDTELSQRLRARAKMETYIKASELQTFAWTANQISKGLGKAAGLRNLLNSSYTFLSEQRHAVLVLLALEGSLRRAPTHDEFLSMLRKRFSKPEKTIEELKRDGLIIQTPRNEIVAQDIGDMFHLIHTGEDDFIGFYRGELRSALKESKV